MGVRTIGQLADAAGVNVETVRYYERRGLLAQPPRTGSGYRQYDDDHLWRLTFIRRAKDLGFTLADIAELVGPGDGAAARSVAGVTQTASARLAAVEADLAALAEVRRRLRTLLDICEGGDDGNCLALGA